MPETGTTALQRLSVLSKNLFKLLDEEFDLLSGRDFVSVETIQSQKIEAMQELDGLWKNVAQESIAPEETILFDEIRSKACSGHGAHFKWIFQNGSNPTDISRV